MLNASEFGNYAAGYAAYYNGGDIGLWGVQGGGHFFEALENNKRKDNDVLIWGDDGMIDKALIMLGAVDAYMALIKETKKVRPQWGWGTRPGQTKQDCLDYLYYYNTMNFGQPNAKADYSPPQRRDLLVPPLSYWWEN